METKICNIYTKLLKRKPTSDEYAICKLQMLHIPFNEITIRINETNERKKILKKKIIDVFMLVRNSGNSLQKTLDVLHLMEICYPKYRFLFWIFENDSTDNTRSLLAAFYKTHEGRCIFANLKNTKWTHERCLQRINDMAYYRNFCKNIPNLGVQLHGTYTNFDKVNNITLNNQYTSKYTLIIDTDIEFTKDTFRQLATILKSDSSVAMVTPFGVHKFLGCYFDTYALELGKHQKYNFQQLKEVTDPTKTYEINSGYAGLCLVRSEIFQKCQYRIKNEHHSEHNYFCKQVREYGKVVMAPGIKVTWTP